MPTKEIGVPAAVFVWHYVISPFQYQYTLVIFYFTFHSRFVRNSLKIQAYSSKAFTLLYIFHFQLIFRNRVKCTYFLYYYSYSQNGSPCDSPSR